MNVIWVITSNEVWSGLQESHHFFSVTWSCKSSNQWLKMTRVHTSAVCLCLLLRNVDTVKEAVTFSFSETHIQQSRLLLLTSEWTHGTSLLLSNWRVVCSPNQKSKSIQNNTYSLLCKLLSNIFDGDSAPRDATTKSNQHYYIQIIDAACNYTVTSETLLWSIEHKQKIKHSTPPSFFFFFFQIGIIKLNAAHREHAAPKPASTNLIPQ